MLGRGSRWSWIRVLPCNLDGCPWYISWFSSPGYLWFPMVYGRCISLCRQRDETGKATVTSQRGPCLVIRFHPNTTDIALFAHPVIQSSIMIVPWTIPFPLQRKSPESQVNDWFPFITLLRLGWSPSQVIRFCSATYATQQSNTSYRFNIFEASITALCGSTGISESKWSAMVFAAFRWWFELQKHDIGMTSWKLHLDGGKQIFSTQAWLRHGFRAFLYSWGASNTNQGWISSQKRGPCIYPHKKNIFGYIKGFPKIGVFLNHRFGGISIYGNSHLVSSFRHELDVRGQVLPSRPYGAGRACPVTLPGCSVSGTEERWKNLWGFLKSWYPKWMIYNGKSC